MQQEVHVSTCARIFFLYWLTGLRKKSNFRVASIAKSKALTLFTSLRIWVMCCSNVTPKYGWKLQTRSLCILFFQNLGCFFFFLKKFKKSVLLYLKWHIIAYLMHECICYLKMKIQQIETISFNLWVNGG